MNTSSSGNAIVVGSGPNGLAAAITLAQAGIPVTVYEGNRSAGGGCRSSELISPGYWYDVASAVHPLAVVSPFFRKLPLKDYGLNWIIPQAAVAHPFDDGTAVLVMRSVNETASTLDRCDRESYRKLMTPMVDKWADIINEVMYFPRIPARNPGSVVSFGFHALRSAPGLANSCFSGDRARALMAGLGVHSVMRLESRSSAAAGLLLTIAAHAIGWAISEGGAQKISDALSGHLRKLGGEIIVGSDVKSIDDLPPCKALMLDVTPAQFLNMASGQLPDSYRRRLSNYKYGPGIFKMDWILDGPVPWKAYQCLIAGTVHIGGSLEEIAAAERSVWENGNTDKPFVILVQSSLFDGTRSIDGKKHIVWAYCHVPNGSKINMAGKIEAQIERFAPGFKGRIIGRHIMYPNDLEDDNPNCVGGDITGGAQSMRRMFFPDISYNTPLPNVFLCSASTPPGPGVHGMCGQRSADLALQKLHGK